MYESDYLTDVDNIYLTMPERTEKWQNPTDKGKDAADVASDMEKGFFLGD